MICVVDDVEIAQTSMRHICAERYSCEAKVSDGADGPHGPVSRRCYACVRHTNLCTDS